METSFFRFWIRILIDKYDMISILSRFEMVNKSLARVLETDFPGGRCSVQQREGCWKKPICDGQLKVMPKVGATGSENSR